MNTLTRTLVIAALLSARMAGGPAQAQQQGGEAPPPAVTVVTLKSADVTLTSSLPGRVAASAEAELRPQVSGLITERLFNEGSVVAEGDPLYRIDPRSYEAGVAQADAALAQAQAQAESARREADRVAALRDRRVASEQTQDSAIAARDAAEAAVKAAEAQLQSARIDLDRTTITSPIDGVIGLAQASQGALVTASQAAPLVVIRRIDPVHVDVTQSAADIVRWQRQGAAAALPEGTDRTVTLRLADGSTYEHTGSLTAAEPHVDETTGVITLRMEVPNPDGFLLPGMYVLADLPQAQLKDVVLAPQEGVTRDRRGRPVAMVVNDQNVVEERLLDIVQDRGTDWVVREGLAAGDRIVVAGLQKIGAGMTVTPEEWTETEADAATAADGSAPADAGADAGSAEPATPDGDGADPAAAGAEDPAGGGNAEAAGN
ncbi:efflux RND transporter periplasmic adaptor subunit [Paracoccus sp. YLB-12]|uniref:Efflux RND transporter periplasmic adaptor subunit n=1 Tax=Paracoccus maritimus TaxID=2933292 RepID=A0ABT2K7I0_9RHOB|nr:efflux RND transporter periplasmic adaptor subunit [Paracoccus sp. YLB-12]MCT4332492.1 efflux RND transporter periplasmic adaptor subunit [Paracoccus sp. YLB-12]